MSDTSFEPSYYDMGDRGRLRGKFTVDGVGTNPGATTFRVERPSGAVDTGLQSGNPEPGTTDAMYDPVEEGEHWWSLDGPPPAKALGERMFVVRPGRVNR